ncbi:hypothetical protein PHYSODRAFT_306600 [Phytophthora sojae]|uniref:ATPase AAA-type core domain-containing protein n=1 Tax=Phytophthora sojae (strain P6497) TaxID=1094619 RepID=G5A9Y9_PHYSP|nr:hypothetical protein PHYSODRAFT_306600 [Phytophthora sojae]EGZ07419.1 hypothetical protein PHYSODRAFT_306600 [Phytophthora sojae]|eukprot:XP_009536985.1 hypothetical protein PHYSODRAFT_306600 [Phytophthora sojae]
MPPECFGGTGIGEDKKQLVLYRRQELVNEWNEIERCCIRTYSHLWIHGPPGTGKSCAALAYACSLDRSEWDVLWIHSSGRRDRWLNWLQGTEEKGTKRTCRFGHRMTDSYLPQVLDAASIARETRPAVNKPTLKKKSEEL